MNEDLIFKLARKSKGEFSNKGFSQQRTIRYKIRYSKMDIYFLGRPIIYNNRHRSDANQKIAE